LEILSVSYPRIEPSLPPYRSWYISRFGYLFQYPTLGSNHRYHLGEVSRAEVLREATFSILPSDRTIATSGTPRTRWNAS